MRSNFSCRTLWIPVDLPGTRVSQPTCSGLPRALVGALRMKLEAGAERSAHAETTLRAVFSSGNVLGP